MKLFKITITFLLLMLLISPLHAEDETLLETLDIKLHGFFDSRAGARILDDNHEEELSLGESRLQLDLEKLGYSSTLKLRADLIYDKVTDDRDLNLDTGYGPVDLREANILLTPTYTMDLKLGRQILTWGTGDLLFINDMFPKDWQSFFTGRDEEYLKAPSDGVLISMFPQYATIDIAYTPKFDPDRFISGERISYWNPIMGSRAGENAVMEPDTPDEWFNNDELAVRISKNISSYEIALYGYNGFWKSPAGMTGSGVTSTPIFPGLSVYGASIRGGLGKGLINAEAGYYSSQNDADGDNPLIPNDETRFLLGYEREIIRDLSGSVQYYVEYMQDYKKYKQGVSADPKVKARQVATLRITKQAMSQNLTLSFFGYYSPTDKDGYIRPAAKYKLTDEWLITAGLNIFDGEKKHTFFGQFKKNSNIYSGIRYSF